MLAVEFRGRDPFIQSRRNARLRAHEIHMAGQDFPMSKFRGLSPSSNVCVMKSESQLSNRVPNVVTVILIV